MKDYIFAAKQRASGRCSCHCRIRRAMLRRILSEALAVIGGVEAKDPLSGDATCHIRNACFLKAYPAETTEANSVMRMSRPFAFFGGVPVSILYDNTRIARCSSILGDQDTQTGPVYSRNWCRIDLFEGIALTPSRQGE